MVAYSVHDLADEIFANEFDYDSGYAQFYYISGWLANNVGLCLDQTDERCSETSKPSRGFEAEFGQRDWRGSYSNLVCWISNIDWKISRRRFC